MSDHAPSTVLSLRQHLVDDVAAFMSLFGWRDSGLPEAMSELLTGLARYREEGKRLFPVVFLTRNLDELMSTVGGSDPVHLGSGSIDRTTVRRALKLCAPLGEGRSWVIFLRIEGPTIRFGVFRSPPSPIQPTALERLRELSEVRPTSFGVVQIAENVIELRASQEFYRYFYLSGLEADGRLPIEIVRTFIDTVTADLPPDMMVGARRLFYRVLMDVVQTWHGALAVVVRKGQRLPKAFCDGVNLDPAISVGPVVARALKAEEEKDRIRAATELGALMNLIRGMLSSDGVTVFSTDAKLLAYNVFIPHEGNYERLELSGGARRRTFEFLTRMIRDPSSPMIAAFYRSQDGMVDCST